MSAIDPNHLQTLAAGVQSAQEAVVTAKQHATAANATLLEGTRGMADAMEKARAACDAQIRPLHDAAEKAQNDSDAAQKELAAAQSAMSAYLADPSAVAAK